MSSKDYEDIEKRFQELFREKRQREMKLEKVSAEYLYVQHRLTNEPIVD